MKISTVTQMRGLDRRAIEEFGIAPELLMENAGQAVSAAILQEFGVKDRCFVVFCGLGNNGGDGFVVARKIHSNGGAVKVFILGDPNRLEGAAKMNADIAARLTVEIEQIESAAAAATEVAHCDCIVDAILGTGITRQVTGLYRDVIELINASGKTVFSVDIPSGIHGDTGQVMGAAVKADVTVTFGLPKIGNVLSPGVDRGGKLYVSHISFPPSMYDADALRVEINQAVDLPPRRRDVYNEDVGQALFITGAAHYIGATYVAASSFLKAGGGHPHLAASRSMVPFIASKGNEITVVPQVETELGSVARQNRDALLELSGRMDVVVLGPGLSSASETQQLARGLIAEIDRPLLLDGASLTASCLERTILSERPASTIVALHLDEMSQLTGMSVREIDVDKITVLRRTATELNVTIVLKGMPSLIGQSDGHVFVNMSGNARMPIAGSGDVLTGAIAAMVGLGLPPQVAARQGTFVHGLAADLAVEEKGEDGITARDIRDALPRAMKMVRDGLDPGRRERYTGARII